MGITLLPLKLSRDSGSVENVRYIFSKKKETSSSAQNICTTNYNIVDHGKDGAGEEVEYEYDENGNFTKDLNRRICKIQYNVLNLPCSVDFQDGSRITYIYNGGGHKLRTDYYINTLTVIMPLPIPYTGTADRRNMVHTWTTYCSNLVLENDTLKMSLFDGGYVSYPQQKTPLDPTYGSDKKPAWHYYLKDHLGSNRVVMSASGTPEQINHYYPYGGLMGESLNITSSQRYSCQPVRYS